MSVAAWLDHELAGPIIRRGVQARLTGARSEAGLADLQELQSFLAGDAILAFLDAPWMPVFIAVIWLMHPLLGWLALAGAIMLLIVAVANDLLTRTVLQRSRAGPQRNQRGAQHYVDNAETVRALGMLGPLLHRWQDIRRSHPEDGERASAVTSALTYLTKSIRLSLQILILGTGAWLVLKGELTGGGMIAAGLILTVHAGQAARVLFPAYGHRNLPQIFGRLLSVSADRITDERTGEAYFLAKVAVEPAVLERLAPQIELSSGMPADVMILTGERTLSDYLIRPFVESITKSFRES